MPVQVNVSGRYDPETVRGAVCFIIDGPEFHTSCWFEDGLGAALHVEHFYIGTGGEYTIEMRNERQRATTHFIVLGRD